MSRLARDGTAEPVSRDKIFRRERGQGNIHFPCSADHEQDWQPYAIDPYSDIDCYNHTILYSTVYVFACVFQINRLSLNYTQQAFLIFL